MSRLDPRKPSSVLSFMLLLFFSLNVLTSHLKAVIEWNTLKTSRSAAEIKGWMDWRQMENEVNLKVHQPQLLHYTTFPDDALIPHTSHLSFLRKTTITHTWETARKSHRGHCMLLPDHMRSWVKRCVVWEWDKIFSLWRILKVMQYFNILLFFFHRVRWEDR